MRNIQRTKQSKTSTWDEKNKNTNSGEAINKMHRDRTTKEQQQRTNIHSQRIYIASNKKGYKKSQKTTICKKRKNNTISLHFTLNLI